MPGRTHDIEVGGRRRPMLVEAPAGPPSAIVLSLHGSTSTPEHQALLSRMGRLAGLGAVVAFPRGSVPARTGWEWDLDADGAFLDAAVDYLRATFDAPGVPLCVTGMSGGARMASRFASNSRNPVSVLGAVAGLRRPAVERPAHPVRVVAFHGTRDRINPLDGGSTARWGESVPDAAAAWARANGRSEPPERSRLTPTLTRLSYGPADDPGAVTLWICAGTGHTWPGTPLAPWARLLMGRVARDVDATGEIWQAVAPA